MLATVSTTFSPAFSRSMAKSTESCAFSASSIWSIRLCMIAPKFAPCTVAFSVPFSVMTAPSLSSSFLMASTAASLAREKASTMRMAVAMFSAVALSTVVARVS